VKEYLCRFGTDFLNLLWPLFGKGRVMFLLYQLAYAMIAGFVAAGAISSVYTILAERRATLAQVVESNWQGLHVVFLSAFAGPWILAKATMDYWRAARISGGLFVAGLSLAGIWSMCLGIVLIKLIESVVPALV
jgi:hypothetical protein